MIGLCVCKAGDTIASKLQSRFAMHYSQLKQRREGGIEVYKKHKGKLLLEGALHASISRAFYHNAARMTNLHIRAHLYLHNG